MSDPYMPLTSVRSGTGFEAAKGVHGLTVQIANVYFIQLPSEPHSFVLIDAGMPQAAGMIVNEAKQRFGEGFQLKAIILTHGHILGQSKRSLSIGMCLFMSILGKCPM